MNDMSIALVCNLGSSTKMLVQKMNEVVEGSEKLSSANVNIQAFPASEVTAGMDNYQAILLAPQVGYRKNEIEEVLGNSVPVEVIDPNDYGTMNGANILKQAIYLIRNS